MMLLYDVSLNALSSCEVERPLLGVDLLCRRKAFPRAPSPIYDIRC